jgi:cell division protein FtsB
MEKRRQIAALQEENATLAADNRRLATWVDKLGKDKAAQRTKVRERLKLLQPGETQFILPEQKPEQKPE